MDGVLADFDKGVVELAGYTEKDGYQDEHMWEKIKEVPNFYDKLDFMPGALDMFNKIYEQFGNKCEILTGIPKERRGIKTAGEDKTTWVRRLLNKDIKVNIVYKEEKKLFCTGNDCILVDDYDENVNDWTSVGGTGILHSNPEETLSIIEEIINK